jgi:hypothetical protein
VWKITVKLRRQLVVRSEVPGGIYTSSNLGATLF